MKKLITLALFTVFLAAGSPIFAQEGKKFKNESEYYYVNISLERIFPYQNGYIVDYRRGLHKMGRTYMPMSWFSEPAGKGEILSLPAGSAWPSMTIYYKNGEFDHVRLYVHRLPSHQTWGVIPQTVNIDSQFDNIEDLKIKF